jgi:hypothetical protein
MRKLKIIEHVSLDGVIQVSAKTISPTATETALSDPAGREAIMAAHGGASICCLAVAPTIAGRVSGHAGCRAGVTSQT